MNMEPANGLGRVLSTPLKQFAERSGHHELADAKLILLGFSGAGSLCARLVEFAPERVFAATLSSPGHYEPLGMDTVHLDGNALAVPQLILAGDTTRCRERLDPMRSTNTGNSELRGCLCCKTILGTVAQQMRRA